MKPTVADTPIVLFYDASDKLAKAGVVADFRAQFDGFAAGLRIGHCEFSRINDDLIFWDYLVVGGMDGQIVGVCLNDFQLNPMLVASRLMAHSANVTHATEYGYDVLLSTLGAEADYDSAQAFGHALYTDGTDCVLMLDNWHDRAYCFPLEREVVFDTG